MWRLSRLWFPTKSLSLCMIKGYPKFIQRTLNINNKNQMVGRNSHLIGKNITCADNSNSHLKKIIHFFIRWTAKALEGRPEVQQEAQQVASTLRQWLTVLTKDPQNTEDQLEDEKKHLVTPIWRWKAPKWLVDVSEMSCWLEVDLFSILLCDNILFDCTIIYYNDLYCTWNLKHILTEFRVRYKTLQASRQPSLGLVKSAVSWCWPMKSTADGFGRPTVPSHQDESGLVFEEEAEEPEELEDQQELEEDEDATQWRRFLSDFPICDKLFVFSNLDQLFFCFPSMWGFPFVFIIQILNELMSCVVISSTSGSRICVMICPS